MVLLKDFHPTYLYWLRHIYHQVIQYNTIITVNNYTALLHNRIHTHHKAKRHYGGVCILLKDQIYKKYNVKIVDQICDGIAVFSTDGSFIHLCEDGFPAGDMV